MAPFPIDRVGNIVSLDIIVRTFVSAIVGLIDWRAASWYPDYWEYGIN